MDTQLKNQWIALEAEYQSFLKEKITQHNSKNNIPTVHPSISSKMTFCKDGVIIKKLTNSDIHKGISFKVFDKTIAEMKDTGLTSQLKKSSEHILAFEVGEIKDYKPAEIAEKDFKEVLKDVLKYQS